VRPSWLGNEDLHESHQKALLHADREFYGRYRWAVQAEGACWTCVWPASSHAPTKTPPAELCPVCDKPVSGTPSIVFDAPAHFACVDRFCDLARKVGFTKPEEIKQAGRDHAASKKGNSQ
jgi:hypothetical protein